MFTLFAWDASRLPWPADWPAMFGREAPLLLEIGFGDAEFLVNLARSRPEANVIGVDISLPSVKKAERKAARLPGRNVQIVHGDARVLLWGGVPPAALDQVFINFPDPWHKAAHHHRKLIGDPFLDLLATRIMPGGRLDIATDDPGYQEVIAASLGRTPFFVSRTGGPFLTADPDRIETKYERKARREGRVPLYFKWQRNDITVPPGRQYPTLQEFSMPHAVIQSPLSLEEIAARFRPERFGGEIPVRFMAIFRQIPVEEGLDDLLIVETHLAEDPMPQRLALFIQARGSGDLLVGLHELGFPRPTAGVHAAVGHLARWLLGLDEGMALRRHNLNVEV